MAIEDIINMLLDEHPEWTDEQIIAAVDALVNG